MHSLQPQYVAVTSGAKDAAPKKRKKEDSLNIFDFLCASCNIMEVVIETRERVAETDESTLI